jgi:aspartate/methionine/tyrosine aminotransferase
VTRFARRPEDGWAIDPDEIARLITPRTKLVVLTNLHNPSSALMDEKALARIGEIAARHGAHVLVDEVYLDCVWDTRPRSAFHLGPNFIVTSSLTKAYGLSGLRCGWIFAPAAIAARLWRLIDLFDNIPSHPSELLSVIAFRKLAGIRERSKRLIETNRAIYREFASKRKFEAPAYGTVVFPRVTDGSANAFCDVLREKYETTVVPGAFFGMPSHVRISLVAQPDVLREGLARLEAALDSGEAVHNVPPAGGLTEMAGTS